MCKVITIPLLLAAGLLPACGKRQQPLAEKPVPVSVFITYRQGMKTVVDVSGRVEPQNRVSVFSQVAGKVKAVSAKEGDKISRNSVLAQVLQDIPGSEYQPHPVKSPIAGTVLKVSISQGATITPQMPLFEVGDTRCLNFAGQVFGEDRALVKPGQRMAITGNEGDTLLGLKVERLAPQLDQVTGGLDIEATICLIKNPLLIGQSVDGHIIVGSSSGIAVPRISLVRDSLGRDGIYLVQGDSAAFRPVRIVNRSEEYFLIEGVPEGEKAVSEGSSDLRPGRKVTVVDE